ncbi:MAG: molybdopterin molybdotransferase MoeA [Phycisphaerae bacterium]
MEASSRRGVRAEAVWKLLANDVRPLEPVDAPLDDALGRTLAADASAVYDYPPYTRSIMDGFAVRCADFSGGAARLRLRELVRAGDSAMHAVGPGECSRINTGGAIPTGADAVVMVEQARFVARGGAERTTGAGNNAAGSAAAGAGWVELADTPVADQHIEKVGSIMNRGDVVLRRGERVTAGAAAALASAGVASVRVVRTPRVALLTTGDELVSAGGRLEAGQVFDSNRIALRELLARSGVAPTMPESCGDDAERLREVLRRGCEHDVLVVVGGMSKGTHDLVPGVLESLGVLWMVESLDLKPGKPTRIGRSRAGGWVVGLPGNPVSCAVCFLLFVRPIVEGLGGATVAAPRTLSGRSDVELPKNGARPMFQPACWAIESDGVPHVSPTPWRGSGDPFGLARANGLLLRDAHAAAAGVGELVRFVPIELPR